MKGDLARALNRGGRPTKPPEERLVPYTFRLPEYQLDEIFNRANAAGVSTGRVLRELLDSVNGFGTHQPQAPSIQTANGLTFRADD